MANLFEETVVDFDLNFLQPIHNVNSAKHDKQRQSIVNIKNKIIKSHCLVQKYYLQKDRLEETESLLLASKEECKQACLDYKVTLEKCLQLEKDSQKLTDLNRELELKLNHLDNQCEAMKSHAHQLQLLAKEHESIIQALNIEKQLEKNTIKETEKKLCMLEKERDTYLKDIKWLRDVILGKKKSKSCKNILNKYKKLPSSEDNHESDKSDNDSYFDESPPGSPIHEIVHKKEKCYSDKVVESGTGKSENKNIITDKENDNDNDSDCCNEEVVSEDTGRGSSLAFSDAEKFLNSPEIGYCSTDKPQKIINKEIIQVDVGTSPMRVEENLVKPVLFSESNGAKSPEYFITDFPLSTEIVTIKEKKQLLDACTSPIPRHYYMKDISTSPIVFENPVEIHSEKNGKLDENVLPVQEDSEHKTNPVTSLAHHMSSDSLSRGSEIEISTAQPEINNSNNTNNRASEDTNNDLEVETILNNMRFRHTLISPIPKTPKKLHKEKISLHNINNSGHIECPDALKIKEENKALHTNISYLCKEIMLIKKILNTKMPNNLATMQNSNLENILDENSQGALILRNDAHRQCDSEGTYVCHNSETSALSRLVDDGPIHIDNNENTQEEEIMETPNSNCHVKQAKCSNVKMTKKHTKEKHYSDEVSKDNLKFTENPHSILDLNSHTTINEKPVQIENQPQIEDSEIREINSDNDSQDVYSCDNQLEDFNQVSKVGEDDITDNGVQNTEDCIHWENDIDNQPVHNVTNQFEFDNTVSRPHKLTKLDKFKKKMVPKSKISRLSVPTFKKLKRRTRVIPVSNLAQRSKPLQILNNKDAYDKALKVMTEIKLKSKDERKKTFHRPNGKLLKSSQDESSIKYSSNKSQDKCLLRKDKKNNLRPLSLDKQELPPTQSLEEANMSDTDHCIHKEDSQISSETKNSSPDDINEVNCTQIITRSKCTNVEENSKDTDKKIETECDIQVERKSPKNSRRRKRVDSNDSNVSCKRMLRSSHQEKKELEKVDLKDELRSKNVIDYNDLDVFGTNIESTVEKENMLVESMGNNLDKTDNEHLYNCNSIPQHIRRSKRLCSNISDTNKSNLTSNIVKDNSHDNKYYKKQNEHVHHKQEQALTKNENNEENKLSFMSKAKICSNDRTISKAFEETTNNTISNTEHKNNLGNSILCKMIVKYGKTIVRHSATKIPDNKVNLICKKIENSIENILELSSGPDKVQEAINEFVEDIKNYNKKSLLAGLMTYLQDPARKLELFNKVNCHPSMAMTKREQIILSALQKLNTAKYNIVNELLCNIEFTLFRLNKTPEFDTIESLSRFYAVTCRLFHMKYRLKTFFLDAMYCLQYKAVTVVTQCLTTWTHILPLAHMKYAKSPLITCIVYLLHFYKCEDKFNRVQNIRTILNKKYLYVFSEWNETKILEMFGNAIKYVKDDPAESNMLRLALLIFGKRHGPKWCQRNVINNMLLPMIEDEKTPEKVKMFCIKVLGPLLKPYPGDMKVHCEIIVNQLLDMLDQENLTHGIKEAIITSLIYMSKHNAPRVTKALLSWQPDSISPELENLLKAYVREKPIKAWKTILSKIYL